MNRKEITTMAQTNIQANMTKGRLLTNQFTSATKTLGGFELHRDELDEIIEGSPVMRSIINQLPEDSKVSLTELGTMASYANWIETGNSKSAMYLRDTAGEKPVDKVQREDKDVSRISDERLEYLLSNAEVENEEADT